MNMKPFLIGAGLLVIAAVVTAMPESGNVRIVSRYLVHPSPLSRPHAFLETRCSACHTPAKGVEAPNCIVCHANDKALLQREPTAFHGNIGSCKIPSTADASSTPSRWITPHCLESVFDNRGIPVMKSSTRARALLDTSTPAGRPLASHG